MAAAGWQVAGFARKAADLERLGEELPEALLEPGEATEPETASRMAALAKERFGRLDAYVHCVGSIFLKPAHLTKPEEWHQTLLLNLTSAFYGLRAAVGAMQGQGGGSVVLISSVAAQAGLANHEAIAAAKSGIEGLVRSAAATYAAQNLRFNAVAPGMVDTRLAQPLLASEQSRTMSERMHPLGRIGKAEQVASLIAWLLSPEADWMTGQVIGMDGGLGAIRPKPRA
jgi:NAD(P)-dependent dehydrogenase (short-subunit alcohol dehydrogenase family)